MGWIDRGDTPFRDRRDAGRQLAACLADLAERDDVTVLALPRGGVPVAYEVAQALAAPLHAFLVRKLGSPGNPELAIGALASDGTVVLDRALMSDLNVPQSYVDAEIERQRAEIGRRLAVYGADLAHPEVSARIVVLVDDGVATGSTVHAAILALRQRSPAAIVLGVPVGPTDVLARLGEQVDRVVAVKRPEYLYGVGAWYADFRQTSDEDVVRFLRAGHADGGGTGAVEQRPPQDTGDAP
jgi:putative phosphoribosyl transferase